MTLPVFPPISSQTVCAALVFYFTAARWLFWMFFVLYCWCEAVYTLHETFSKSFIILVLYPMSAFGTWLFTVLMEWVCVILDKMRLWYILHLDSVWHSSNWFYDITKNGKKERKKARSVLWIYKAWEKENVRGYYWTGRTTNLVSLQRFILLFLLISFLSHILTFLPFYFVSRVKLVLYSWLVKHCVCWTKIFVFEMNPD